MSSIKPTDCPCGTKRPYAQCCEPYLLGKALAPTPEALMRSRYSAYVKGIIPYLRDSLAPASRGDYDENSVRAWALSSEWLGLEVLAAQGSTVEFIARYRAQGNVVEHRETATFEKQDGRWYFVDGVTESAPQKPVVRETPKPGRNDPCACGSGKKFKKCCAAA